jgi:hypothetical protein
MSEAILAAAQSPRTARSRAATRTVWIERLARFPQSSLTAAQFCAVEAVSLPSFYSWKRRLAAEAQDALAEHAEDSGSRLLSVRLPQPGPAVELVLTSGALLRLPSGCDLDWVRSLVTALGGVSC